MYKKKKKTHKWWIVSILIVLCGFFFITQSTLVTLYNKEPITNYSNVLLTAYNRNDEFGDRSITDIGLLASHDALSYEISYNSNPNVNETGHIVNNKFLFTFGKGAMVRYAKAQRHDVLTQLNCGVRLLDARITFVNNDYYTSHGLVSHRLEESLKGILTFLNENPGEFVIFYILNYYQGDSTEQELFDYISTVKVNDKNLFDYVNYNYKDETSIKDITYNKLTDYGSKAGVFIFYNQKENSSYSDYLKLSKAYSKHWTIIDPKDKDIEIPYHIENMPNEYDGLRILQGQLAPNEKNIIGTLFGWSLLDMGEDCNAYMIENPSLDSWLEELPIYMCDYVTSTKKNFNDEINKKILEFNCK